MLAQVQLGIGFVVAAACFPVHIPRTRYHLGVADVFVFALLALHGAPAAALAAGAEGLVGAWRSSKRLTSRVSTPAAATASMAAAGLLFEALDAALLRAGWSAHVATLGALGAAALPYFAGTSLPLLAVMAAKTGRPLSLRDWAQGYSWLAAIYLASAAVAGVLVMNSRQFGGGGDRGGGPAGGRSGGLLHVSLRRHEADRLAQEARISEAESDARANQLRFTAAFVLRQAQDEALQRRRRQGLILSSERIERPSKEFAAICAANELVRGTNSSCGRHAHRCPKPGKQPSPIRRKTSRRAGQNQTPSPQICRTQPRRFRRAKPDSILPTWTGSGSSCATSSRRTPSASASPLRAIQWPNSPTT